MALLAYRAQVLALLQAPSSPIPLESDTSLDGFINQARAQVAQEGECIRDYGTLAVNGSAQQYGFAAINLNSAPGVAQPINVRMISYEVAGGGGGKVQLVPREWEWFNYFVLGNPVPVAGVPKYWAQFGQGYGGSLFVNLLDGPYTLDVDSVCLPLDLVDDATPEAIPRLWTDAVQFYATWLAMMNQQRQGDAEEMLKRYQRQMQRARGGATPSVLPGQYEQGPDPMAANRLSISQGRVT